MDFTFTEKDVKGPFDVKVQRPKDAENFRVTLRMTDAAEQFSSTTSKSLDDFVQLNNKIFKINDQSYSKQLQKFSSYLQIVGQEPENDQCDILQMWLCAVIASLSELNAEHQLLVKQFLFDEKEGMELLAGSSDDMRTLFLRNRASTSGDGSIKLVFRLFGDALSAVTDFFKAPVMYWPAEQPSSPKAQAYFSVAESFDVPFACTPNSGTSLEETTCDISLKVPAWLHRYVRSTLMDLIFLLDFVLVIQTYALHAEWPDHVQHAMADFFTFLDIALAVVAVAQYLKLPLSFTPKEPGAVWQPEESFAVAEHLGIPFIRSPPPKEEEAPIQQLASYVQFQGIPQQLSDFVSSQAKEVRRVGKQAVLLAKECKLDCLHCLRSLIPLDLELLTLRDLQVRVHEEGGFLPWDLATNLKKKKNTDLLLRPRGRCASKSPIQTSRKLLEFSAPSRKVEHNETLPTLEGPSSSTVESRPSRLSVSVDDPCVQPKAAISLPASVCHESPVNHVCGVLKLESPSKEALGAVEASHCLSVQVCVPCAEPHTIIQQVEKKVDHPYAQCLTTWPIAEKRAEKMKKNCEREQVHFSLAKPKQELDPSKGTEPWAVHALVPSPLIAHAPATKQQSVAPATEQVPVQPQNVPPLRSLPHMLSQRMQSFSQMDQVESQHGEQKEARAFLTGSGELDGEIIYKIEVSMYSQPWRIFRVHNDFVRLLEGLTSEGFKIQAKLPSPPNFFSIFDRSFDNKQYRKLQEFLDEVMRRTADDHSDALRSFLGDLQVGSKVNARYQAGQLYLPGLIVKSHPDNSFDIQYDNGFKETYVQRELICHYSKKNVAQAPRHTVSTQSKAFQDEANKAPEWGEDSDDDITSTYLAQKGEKNAPQQGAETEKHCTLEEFFGDECISPQNTSSQPTQDLFEELNVPESTHECDSSVPSRKTQHKAGQKEASGQKDGEPEVSGVFSGILTSPSSDIPAWPPLFPVSAESGVTEAAALFGCVCKASELQRCTWTGSAEITGYQKMDCGGEVVFTIEVVLDEQRWGILREYSHFQVLSKALKWEGHKVAKKLPSRPNFLSRILENTFEDQKEHLTEYIRSAFGTICVQNSQALQDFLKIDQERINIFNEHQKCKEAKKDTCVNEQYVYI